MLVGLDVNSKGAIAVATDVDGAIVGDLPQRFDPGSDADPSVRLAEYVERLKQHWAGKAQLVVLTDFDMRQVKPTLLRRQAYLEAAALMAARRVDARVKVVHQRTVASHLGLPASSSKAVIRDRIAEIVGAHKLLPEPQRRARALGAVWQAAGIEPEIGHGLD